MDIKKFVIWWNNNFPFDYWWRKRHDIPFNSSNHREVDFIDQKFEFEEEKIYKNIRDNKQENVEDSNNYKKTGIWLQPERFDSAEDQEISEEEFENISWEELED